MLETFPEMRTPFESILAAIGTSQEQQVIHQEYDKMGRATISHGVFEKYPFKLLVARVNDVSWSDWGSGPRVLETLNKLGKPFKNLQDTLIVA